jgi:hypothetical protein
MKKLLHEAQERRGQRRALLFDTGNKEEGGLRDVRKIMEEQQHIQEHTMLIK